MENSLYQLQTFTYKQIKGNVLQLDLYKPQKTVMAKAPVLMLSYGGGFIHGSKKNIFESTGFLTEHLFNAGYAVAAMDYRLQPGRCIDGLGMQYEDCMDSLRYLAVHADELGIDAGNIGLLGISAGGTMVQMCGFCGQQDFPGDPGLAGAPAFKIRFIVNYFGIPDFKLFESLYHDHKKGAGVWWHNDLPENVKEELRIKNSPITYLKKSSPPILTLHGTNDMTVPYKVSEELHKKADEIGHENTLITVKEAGHGWGPALDREKAGISFEEIRQRVLAFMLNKFGENVK